MYQYNVNVINKLQNNNAKFVIKSSPKGTVYVQSSTFVPNTNAKYIGNTK